MKRVLLGSLVATALALTVQMASAAEVVFDRTFELQNNRPFYLPLPGDPNGGVLGVLLSEEVWLCATICNPSLNETVNQNHARADAQSLNATRPSLPTTIMTWQYIAQSWETGNNTMKGNVDLVQVGFGPNRWGGLAMRCSVRVRIVKE
jgi:hypothetical protein